MEQLKRFSGLSIQTRPAQAQRQCKGQVDEKDHAFRIGCDLGVAVPTLIVLA
jgi:hypothetical protein